MQQQRRYQMKSFATIVWGFIGAALFLGIYGVIFMVLYAIAVFVIGMFKPQWLDKFYNTMF